MVAIFIAFIIFLMASIVDAFRLAPPLKLSRVAFFFWCQGDLNFAGPAFAKDLVQGQEVFSKSCSVCHNGGQSIFTDGTKTLSMADLHRNNLASLPSIVSLLKSGKGLMPAFKNSEEEVQAVAEYVFDTALGDKW